MKKIVLTGGPCSGKTTVLGAIKEEFGDKVILVPEVATVILGGGFPIPGKDLEWSNQWQEYLQAAVLPLQKSFEKAYELKAENNGSKIMICDRGILDGAIYTKGGIASFCEKYDVNEQEALDEYDAIIHLVSLAVISPEKYGKTNNDQRFENIDVAKKLEKAAIAVWEKHNHRIIIDRDDIIIDRNKRPTDKRRPLQIGKINKGGQGERIYSIKSAGITLSAYGGGVASKTGAYLVGNKIRKLSPKECARLQGFPEDFEIPVTAGLAYKQFGDSVSIPVLESIFRQVLSTYPKLKK